MKIGARTLVLATLLSLSFLASAQVTHVTVHKNVEHVQTSATQVVVNPEAPGPMYGGPYGFDVIVEGNNIAGIPIPTVSGPFNLPGLGSFFNTGKLTYNAGDSAWRLGVNGNGWGSPNKPNLDSLFGMGTYTVVVNGTSLPVNLGAEAYPNVPVITFSGGFWRNGQYIVDPARALTITTNAFTSYGANVNGVMVLGTDVNGGIVKIQGHDGVPSPNFLTLTIPAGTYVAGQEYEVFASFQAVVSLNLGLPGAYSSARYITNTLATIKAEAPIFPMTVSGSIGPTTSNITANIQYRPQDVGSTGSVYTFAVAPQSIVQAALLKDGDKLLPPLGYATKSDGSKADTAVACVLSQLTASGQLRAVSVSGLQAFVSGVLGAQGQAVAVINGVATVNIAGATFYVGYGSSAQSMLGSGVNRNVVAVPGSLECKPTAPDTGWWWNTAEGGRGYSMEVNGRNIFWAAFLYDDAGKSNWYVAGGATSIDGSLFTGDLLRVTGGQTLGGAYKAPSTPAGIGALTLAFNGPQNGTMVWPGGTVAIERMNIVPNGLTAPKQTGVPESGWWWNPNESGRGFFIEWQNGFVDLAGYMYDDTGAATWYLSVVATPQANAITGNWWLYANGQSLTSAYKPATRVNDNVAPLTIQFTSETTAILSLPNGRTTNLVRHRF